MGKTQQLGKDVLPTKNTVPSENHELNNTNTEQQFNAHIVEDIAYNVTDRRMTYQHKTKSYDEERDQYAEQAFRNYDYEKNQKENASESSSQTSEAFSRSYGAGTGAAALIESKSPVSGEGPPDGRMSSPDKYGISMTAEAPELWKNTAALQKNEALQEKLDGRRK